jgi:hypothetical protein
MRQPLIVAVVGRAADDRAAPVGLRVAHGVNQPLALVRVAQARQQRVGVAL